MAAEDAQNNARECVRSTILNPQLFCFDHLLRLSAVDNLKETDPLLFEMLSIFVYGSLSHYQCFIAAHPTFLRDELRVEDKQTLETKIKQLTLISMAEKTQTISLLELAKDLDISDNEDLELFLIDAIHANAIQGKINEIGAELVVNFYQQRVFESAQWNQLHTRLGGLLDNVRWFRDSMQSVVEGGE
uniref:PCI domain-containing protein n=1 Tax=Globodera pallida TaxID=36090 RepID=A0A183CHQ7_GLOPA